MDLFSSYRLGDLTLKNRMVMSAMTRNRALAGEVPNPLAATYYAQRAAAGLIVTEGTQVSPQGMGYIRTPGIHSPEQVAGWAAIVDAVHRAGGLIFLQLWHVGRVSHPDYHDGALPVAPSAIGFDGEVYTPQGLKPKVVPRALDRGEIPDIVEQFRLGAERAKRAGFDGVELHGANGYLLDQFLRDGTNQRLDDYGGSVANRARLPIEVAEAVASVWGAERVGYKISPSSDFNGMSDSNPAETFSYLATELGARRIGFLHVTESIAGYGAVPADRRLASTLRARFAGAFMLNGGHDAASGQAAIASGAADLIAYGKTFLANPDLPRRFKEQAALNPPDTATFYMGEERGYVDYPSLDPLTTA